MTDQPTESLVGTQEQPLTEVGAAETYAQLGTANGPCHTFLYLSDEPPLPITGCRLNVPCQPAVEPEPAKHQFKPISLDGVPLPTIDGGFPMPSREKWHVDYKPRNTDQARYCKACLHFDGRRRCSKVQGRIGFGAVCDLFKPLSPSSSQSSTVHPSPLPDQPSETQDQT